MLPTFNELRDLIERNTTFVLTTHVNPDGDGLGSELAMFHFLVSIGKNPRIINHSATPENYLWMDPQGIIAAYDPDVHAGIISGSDVILILDTNQSNRLRSMEPSVLASRATKVVIDHHLEAQPFADLYLIDTDATSTGEIIFRLLTDISTQPLTGVMATALYAAIMTDTGSFRFPRTDADIHQIAATLLQYGVDPSAVYSNIYDTWTPGRMRLLGEMLDSMKTGYGGRLAYVVCTKKMFAATGTTEVETDNFTNYPMSVAGVRIGILVNELDDGVKVSFRSRGSIPVNELAKRFGGNGHLNAAGARIHGVTLAEILPRIVGEAEEFAMFEEPAFHRRSTP